MKDALMEQIGRRAVEDAIEISAMPITIRAINFDEIDKLRPIFNEIKERVQSNSISILTNDGHFYRFNSATTKENKLLESDLNLALKRDSSFYKISTFKGTQSIQGFSPIINRNGDVIGVIGLSIPNADLKNVITYYDIELLLTFFTAFVLCGFSAHFISKNLKKSIFNLEPEQIARLFRERSCILNSIKEGVISFDYEGSITDTNLAARNFLNKKDIDFINLNLSEIIGEELVTAILRDKKPIHNCVLDIQEIGMYVNFIPIESEKMISGFVMSFRPLDEISYLNQELEKSNQYSDLLRSQTHEYSNKLHTLWGLIQSRNYHQACLLIAKETDGYQKLISFLFNSIPDPLLSGLFLGKYNRAKELGVELSFDELSSMRDIPAHIDRSSIITVLGNVLDNALEASLEFSGKGSVIYVSMTDIGDELVFEIEDMGGGLEKQTLENIFVKGYSSKSGNSHGFGMFLVKRALKDLRSSLDIQSEPGKFTRFSLFVPKEI
jgi:two-component system CitB family sensor kinase